MYCSDTMSENQNAPGDKTFVMLPPSPPEDTRSGILSNILAIAGFIIVIVVIIWGLVHLASISRNWFGSLFGTSDEATLEVMAPETANSGKAFDITWDHESDVAGSYAFLYQCVNGFLFVTPNPAGGLGEIPCGAAYTVPSENKVLSLMAILTGTTSVPMPLSVIFLPSATGTQVQGSATVMIMGGETGSVVTPTPSPTPTPPSPSPTPTPTPIPAPRPITPADLMVRIIAVGVIDTYSGVFVNRTPASPSEIAAVQFEIVNIGGKSSGTYYFTAQLPVDGQGYSYNSPLQASLTPGSRMVNTLRFTQTRSGGGTFSVSVDPSNVVRESNENNNYASQFVSAPNWGSYGQYPQYPYGGQYPYMY